MDHKSDIFTENCSFEKYHEKYAIFSSNQHLISAEMNTEVPQPGITVAPVTFCTYSDSTYDITTL